MAESDIQAMASKAADMIESSGGDLGGAIEEVYSAQQQFNPSSSQTQEYFDALNKFVDQGVLGNLEIIYSDGASLLALDNGGTTHRYDAAGQEIEQGMHEEIVVQDYGEHQVQEGESLWRIARRELRSQLDHKPSDREIANYVNEIAKFNGLDQSPRDRDLIYTTDVLKLPKFGTEVARASGKVSGEVNGLAQS